MRLGYQLSFGFFGAYYAWDAFVNSSPLALYALVSLLLILTGGLCSDIILSSATQEDKT